MGLGSVACGDAAGPATLARGEAGAGLVPSSFLTRGKARSSTSGERGGEVGRISYWWGKVNVHKAPGGPWTHDADCSSGASLEPLSYCQKFFPGTDSVTEVPVTPKPDRVWFTAGCGASYSNDGLKEFVCNDHEVEPRSAPRLTVSLASGARGRDSDGAECNARSDACS
ncbi:hypothetical protein DRW03_14435 [Corallococcus sp. H22C18031201]|nr:hypothetical protein DRW03_14435 [Corallococcus sp. H22C18031201]